MNVISTSFRILLIAVCLSISPDSNAQPVFRKTDSIVSKQDRADILNLLRQLVKKEIGLEAKFVVQSLQRGNNWVLIQVHPVQPDGSDINYRKTKYYTDNKEQIDNGFFDDHVLALLQLKNGAWKIVEYEIGATDYPGQYWLEQHKIEGLFQ